MDGPASWLTTGLFPQAITIRLAAPVEVSNVTITCFGIRTVALHSAAAAASIDRDALDLVSEHTFPDVVDFAALLEKERQDKNTAERNKARRRMKAQAHTFTLPGALRTRELKLVIVSGQGDFASVSRLRIQTSKTNDAQSASRSVRRHPDAVSTVSGLSRLALA
jgi:hypothetical protein